MAIDHREFAFEYPLVNVAGYEQGDPDGFDPARAIDPAVFLAFVQDSQPTTWDALEKLVVGDVIRTVVAPRRTCALPGKAQHAGAGRSGERSGEEAP